MKLRNIFIALIVAVVAVIASGLGPVPNKSSYPDPSRIGPLADTAAAIVLFQDRVATDPNPINLTLLAQLQARRSRETGDITQLSSAEAALNQALTAQPDYAPAVSTLASLLFAQHRFDEALAAAHRAHDLNPRLGALALVGDVLLATGDYEGAALTYSEVAATTSSPGLTARIAHLNELSGRPRDAIAQMEEAAATHLRQGGVGEEAAWFQVRLGDLNFSIGNLEEADHRYRAALELFPRYWSALAGRAKVSAARGDFDRAIDFYESAAAVLPRPEIMLALGDVYSAAGKSAEATDSYATVEVIAQLADGAYDRALALYFAEHGRPDDAVNLAEAGLATRKDIYSYDALAWALYHQGRSEEARQAMDQAMLLGTQDPILLFHSGAISFALGNEEAAADELNAALELNPGFHPIYGPQAQKLLDEIGQVVNA